mgnify:FL=1
MCSHCSRAVEVTVTDSCHTLNVRAHVCVVPAVYDPDYVLILLMGIAPVVMTGEEN